MGKRSFKLLTTIFNSHLHLLSFLRLHFFSSTRLPAAAGLSFSTSLHLFVLTFLLLTFAFSHFKSLSAQVIIKERIEIVPGTSTGKNPTVFHKFIDDDRNPYYLRYGGYVSLNFLELSGFDYRNFLLGEEEIGIFGSYQDVYLGPYPQWQKLYFTLTDPDDSTRYSPDFQNIVNVNGTLLEFNPSRNPGDPYPFSPEMAWAMELQSTDSSLAVMPPAEILNWEDGFGNPFAAAEYMTPYDDGVLYLVIKNAKNNPTVDLYMESPQELLLQANVSSAVGDTIEIGEIIAWEDVLRFYVKSNNPLVSGMKMYPYGDFEDFYIRSDGSVHLGDFIVEDWTDQTFDDLEFEVIMTPYDPDYFTTVEVTFSKEKIKPGDTVDVALWDKNNEEAFPQDQLFDVVIVEGAEYAAILDITSQDTLDSFDDILQGFKIIAADSIGTDSVTVRIKVGYLNDIIIFTKSIKDDEKIKPNAHAEYKKKAVKSKNSKTTNPTMAKSSGGENNNIEAFDEDNNIGFGSVVIKNSPTFYIKANFTVPEFEAGDTLDVMVKKVDEFGNESSFADSSDFEVGIVEGCDIGNILAPDGEEGQYFLSMKMPIKFIVADSLETDSAKVILRVGIESTDDTTYLPYSEFMQNNKMTEKANFKNVDNGNYGEPSFTEDSTSILACSFQDFMTDAIDTPEAKLVETIEIMLGETKYFQAKENTTTNEIKIEEIQPDANGVPQQNSGDDENGFTWITENVWGDEPVEVVIENDTSGRKMGVYWERKYPVKDQWIDFKSKKNTYQIVKMNNLSTDLVRIIARYWTPDSTYKVKLKAETSSGDTANVYLKITKPVVLLSPGQTHSYSKTKDVNNDTVSIDSLCILFGGKYGIPPQFIKGQIYKEAAPKDFGGDIGQGFAPSYRYEPYTVQFWTSIEDKPKYNQYYISDSSYSFDDVPNHQHVLTYNYFNSIRTVWDIIENYSQIVNSSNPATYGSRDSSNFMSFKPYDKESVGIQQEYDKFKDKIASDTSITSAQKADSTNNRMIRYFKEDWGEGATNIIAQTRAASSYGLLQALYTTARDRNYPISDVPENINLLSYFEIFLKTQKRYLKDGLGENVESGNNWNKGFEYMLSTNIYVPNWNTISTYAKWVYVHSQKFLPSNQTGE